MQDRRAHAESFDTNILVSGPLFPGRRGEAALQRIVEQRNELVLSKPILDDDPDNRVLECALTGRAQAIVTGDRALLALHDFRGVRLLTLRVYLE